MIIAGGGPLNPKSFLLFEAGTLRRSGIAGVFPVSDVWARASVGVNSRLEESLMVLGLHCGSCCGSRELELDGLIMVEWVRV